jgi:GDPmannose 4,6-dehydratase
MPTALITGITGQDGSYLAEHLLSQGYAVHGLVRGQANPKRPLVESMLPEVQVIEGDLLDQTSLINAVQRSQPDEIYNLAAISFVALSWNQAELTAETTGLGVLRMLEAVRLVTGATPSRSGSGAGIKFYQASSSEMFGKVRETPQNEQTPFYPRSPYGVAKVYGHYIAINYRESYGLFACSGILFNHESPRRGPEFVTRKLSLGAARVKLGKQKDGQPRVAARLGLRTGLRPRDAPDAPAAGAGRLRDRHGRVSLSARVRGAGVPHGGAQLRGPRALR